MRSKNLNPAFTTLTKIVCLVLYALHFDFVVIRTIPLVHYQTKFFLLIDNNFKTDQYVLNTYMLIYDSSYAASNEELD